MRVAYKLYLFLIVFLLLSSFIFSSVRLASATTYLDNGFESGDLTGWTEWSSSGTVAAQGTTKYAGSYALKANISGSTTYARVYQNLASAYTTLYARAYVQISALPPSSGYYTQISPMISSNDGSTTLADMRIYNNGTGYQWALRYYTNGGSLYSYANTPTPSTSTWYYIEIQTVIDASAGAVRAWITQYDGSPSSGSPTIEVTGIANNGGGNAQRISVGTYSTESYAVSVYADAVVAANSWIGLITTDYFPFIQQTSDIDSAADIGTHSNFESQQVGPDSTNDTLTEIDSSACSALNYIDNDSSDVDSSADKGTEDAFANMQSAPDSSYNTLNETDQSTATGTFGDTSGSGSSYRTTAANEMRLGVFTASRTGEVASIVFYGRGSVASANCKAIITTSSGVLLTNGIGSAVSVSTTAGTKTLTYAAGSRPLVTNGTTYWIGLITETATRIYYDSTTGATSKQDTSNSYSTPTNPTDAGSTTETWRLMYANINDILMKVDQEFQWTTANYTMAYKEVCVKTGTLGSENLQLQVYNGSWQTLSSGLTASAWNNYTVSSYLINSNLTIRFIDATLTDDPSADTYQIDSIVLSTWTLANYTMMLEEKFANITTGYSSRDLCIFTGTYSGSETLSVQGWNTGNSSWTTITTLTANQWNNASVTSWINSSATEFYIRFIDGNTTEDTSQNTWMIDTTYLWTHPTWFNSSITETSNVADAKTSNLALVSKLSASVGITDTLINNLGRAVALTGSVGVSDSKLSGITIGKTVTSAVGIVDVSGVTKGLYNLMTGNFTIVDSLIQLKAFLFANSGSAALVSASNVNVALLFTNTGAVAIIDGNALLLALQNNLLESVEIITLGDSGKALLLSNTELIGIADISEILKALGVDTLDEIEFADVLDAVKTIALNVVDFTETESLSASDSLEALKALLKDNVDSVEIVPILSSNLALLFLNDGSVYIVDLSTFLKYIQVSLLENIGSETVLEALKAIEAPLIDVIEITDDSIVIKEIYSALTEVFNTETVNLTDVFESAKALAVSNSDAIVIVSLNSNGLALVIFPDGSIYLVDDYSEFLKSLYNALTDTLTLTGDATGEKSIWVLIAEYVMDEISHIQDNLESLWNTIVDLSNASASEMLILGAVIGAIIIGSIGFSFVIYKKRTEEAYS